MVVGEEEATTLTPAEERREGLQLERLRYLLLPVGCSGYFGQAGTIHLSSDQAYPCHLI